MAVFFLVFAFLVLAIFQILLICGLPFGEFAWGGQHKILPKYLRITSVSSIVIYGLISVLFLSKSGTFDIFKNKDLVDFGCKFFAIYITLGIPVNAISRSKKERFTITPIVIILAILAWLIIL
jgi:hypothetical protein